MVFWVFARPLIQRGRFSLSNAGRIKTYAAKFSKKQKTHGSFTENEFIKMESYGEDYHLYRICRFNEDDNTGDLFIYSGKEMITDTFEFRSKMYVLERKNAFAGDPNPDS
jgi:hypothetical protein